MKYCPGCKQTKGILLFSKNKRRYDGLQNYCKACKSLQDRKYYIKDRTKQYKRVKRYREAALLKIWDYLTSHACIDCGNDNPVVLEFDHLRDKKASISDLVRLHRSSWRTIQNEIEKCVVRCANCHRIKTAKERKWSIFGLLAQR